MLVLCGIISRLSGYRYVKISGLHVRVPEAPIVALFNILAQLCYIRPKFFLYECQAAFGYAPNLKLIDRWLASKKTRSLLSRQAIS